MVEQAEAKTINGSKKRESIIIRMIRLHEGIHHNGLKKLVVPKYMATKTFERIIKDFIARKIINVQSKKNRKHYSVPLGFPDRPVSVHLSELSQLVDGMRDRLKELKSRYPRFSKKKKEQLALDLAHMYYDIRIQVIKTYEIMGKKIPVVLGEYDTL